MTTFPVPNPIAQRPRSTPNTGAGLLGVAPTIDVAGDGTITDTDGAITPLGEHWVTGMTWQPEGCKLSGATDLTGAGKWTPPGGDYALADAQEFVPFIVFAKDAGSAMDTSRDRVGRAKRALLVEQSYQIALEFEAGAIASAQSYPNRYLDDNSLTTIDGPEDPTLADSLACLDGALTHRLRNVQGMIHMTPTMLAEAAQTRFVRWNAGTPYSPNGHVIAADAGYAGAFFDGHSTTFGTDMVRILLGPIQSTPLGADGQPTTMALDTNDVEVFAWRTVGYQWDGCVHIGIQTPVEPCT